MLTGSAHLLGSFVRRLVRLLPFVHENQPNEVGVLIVSRAETRRDLDALARRELNMTGPEFVAALRNGTLPMSPAVDHLALLADVADSS